MTQQIDELADLDDIAALCKCTRSYARDKLVKRAGFPRPSLSLSQKMRRWLRADVESWMESQRKKQLR